MEDIKVSVFAVAYNHAPFIERALDSLINQKTNFKYEILVHDDASTDGTAEIIKRYAEKYPDLIKPVLQTENQYVKGLFATTDFLPPLAKGKYIAVIECDDCWCDDNKLQRQFDFMESHPKCVLCTGNTDIFDMERGEITGKFNYWKKLRKLTEKDVFIGWSVHWSTFFFKKEYFNSFVVNFPACFGDYKRLTSCFYYGEVWCLPQVLSIYSFKNPYGMNMHVHRSMESLKNIKKENVNYLYEFDKVSNGKFNRIISKIVLRELKIIFCWDARELCKEGNFKQIKPLIKEVKNSEPYKRFFKSLSIADKIKISLRFTVWSRKLAYKIKKR